MLHYIALREGVDKYKDGWKTEPEQGMRRCVIVGGAPIERAEELRAYLRADDYMVYCDCGLRHEKALGRAPDLIVGDFDSHEDPHAAAETIVLPRVKDDTDSFFAAKEALRRGFRDFLLLGMTGARLDHTLGNLALMRMLEGAGAKAYRNYEGRI